MLNNETAISNALVGEEWNCCSRKKGIDTGCNWDYASSRII